MGGPTLISVQATYKLYQTGSGAVACDEVINIPLAYAVAKQVRMNKIPYLIVPVVEFNVNFRDIHFNIVTNEGILVEPFSTRGRLEEVNPYEGERFYFVLPRGTTGIKDVVISPSIPNTLEYGIMPPPYNYDNALFGVITSEVENLKDRVDGLNLVTNSPYFPLKQLPKGAGRQTINIENGMLYFHTIPNFPNISGDKTMNLIITLNDGVLDKSYTLALSKGSEAVLVDLVAGGIFVYLPSTGEVLKELRFNTMTSAYKTISYEGFDDILLDKLQVTISGRKIA